MSQVSEFDIAVIGIAGQFPSAKDKEQFWQNLNQGQVGVRELRSDERVLSKSDDARIWTGGVLDGRDTFDAHFFGIRERDAQLFDPQLRLSFEQTWLSIEDAGYASKVKDHIIGLFMGAGLNHEWIQKARHHIDENLAAQYELNTVTYRDFFATRIAYQLGLTGPAITVNTACSTSLVSIHMACQALLADECEMAVAGGVHLIPNYVGYEYQNGMVLSPDGQCRPFDHTAEGTIWGEGAAFVTLKKASDAIEAGDRIYAMVKGSAINNDGNAKVGYTAPSVTGQEQVIRQALEISDVTPEDIHFIETHGTGTKLGDPLEISAILKVHESRNTPLYLGAVKANIGHLDIAAGVTGFIKAALSLYHRMLPGHPSFEKKSKAIKSLDSRSLLEVNRSPIELPKQNTCYAGVSSFGIGGTNAHVILSSAPELHKPIRSELPYYLLVNSAKSESSAQFMASDLTAVPLQDLADTAYTLFHRKPNLNKRLFCIRDSKKGKVHAEYCATPALGAQLVFVFPGQGSQYRGMSQDLYQTLPAYRRYLDQCFERLENHGFHNAKHKLFDERTPLTTTEDTQPLLFSVQWSLANYLMDLGLQPDYMIGHSLGEIVAATLGGAINLDDAFAFVIERGLLMGTAPKGHMFAVETTELNLLLPAGAFWALHNSPSRKVIGVDDEHERDLLSYLEQNDLTFKRIATEHAFHTPSMHTVALKVQKYCEENMGSEYGSHEPTSSMMPIALNVTGKIEHNTQFDAQYWSSHITDPVLFSQGVNNIIQEANNVTFVEIGPSGGLASCIQEHYSEDVDVKTIQTLGNKHSSMSDYVCILSTLGKCWARGHELEADNLFPHSEYQIVSVPPYRLDRKPYNQVRQQGKYKASTPTRTLPTSNHSEEPKSENTLLDALAAQWQSSFSETLPNLETTNFFSAGGDSLSASSFASGLSKRVGISIPVAWVISGDTLDALYEKLKKAILAPKKSAQVNPDLNQAPLTLAQERMWTMAQLDSIEDYHICEAFRFKGQLCVASLECALNQLILRHASLRTTYHAEGDNVYQQVAQTPSTITLNAIPATEETLPSQIEKGMKYPFDLDKDLMFRATLFKIDSSSHVLLIVVNHIASDGSSMSIIARDLSNFYDAAVNKVAPSLTSIEASYCNYAQQLANKKKSFIPSMEYWLDRLKGLEIQPPIFGSERRTELTPIAKNRTALSPALNMELTKQCKALGVTPFVCLSTLLGLVIGNTQHQRDVAIGTTVSDRPSTPEFEHVVGFFTNTLIMRHDLDSKETLEELLIKNQGDFIQDWGHLHLDFSSLLEAMHVERKTDAHPLFQTMFVSIEKGELPFEDLATSPEPLPALSMPFDLYIDTWLDDEERHFTWKYRTDVHSESSITYLCTQFESMVSAFIKHPNLSIKNELTLPSNKLDIVKWQTGENLPCSHASQTVLQLFEKQCKQHPHRHAVTDADITLTYRQLDQKANQLAHWLNEQGVQAGSAVAICLPRGHHMALAILATMKAGAHYVPIDPSYPLQRMSFMLEDASVGLVIDSQTNHQAWSYPYLSIEALDWDSLPLSQPDVTVSQNDTAYVIYTSGSTGRPKGVTVSHGNLLHYCLAAQQHYDIKPHDAVAQITSIGFDASVEEHMMSLCFGAHLVYRDEAMLTSLDAFAQFIQRHHITVVSLPTALWHVLCDELDTALTGQLQRTLRLCIMGGEAMQPARLAHWQQQDQGHIQLLNTYGPTETTVIATVMDVTHENPHCAQVPIGRPIAEVSAWVMDDSAHPSLPGEAGELWISGPTVAQGYLNLPEQTEKVFVQHHHNEQPTLCYRTGDSVRWNSEGQLVYLGRLDNQIKYRGYRVEPSEIEAIVNQHPAVVEAVVGLRGELLSAWVVSSSSSPTLLNECATQIRAQLPEHMQPTHWALLDKMPLTTNGKTDHKALPTPTSLSTHARSIQPMTEQEAEVAELWKAVLGCKHLKPEDSFFELGGHSLSLTKLFSQIQKKYGIKPDFGAFIRQPTLRSITKALFKEIERFKEAELSDNSEPNFPSMRRTPADPTELSLNQKRLWFLEKSHAGNSWMLHFAWRMSGDLNLSILKQALNLLLIKHQSLRTSIDETDGNPRLKVHAPQGVLTSEFDLTELPSPDKQAQYEQILKECATKSIPLDASSMISATIIKEHKDQITFALSLHHIACDGWSIGLLIKDIDTFYSALSHQTSLPNLSSSCEYADFTQWQNTALNEGHFQPSIEYWHNYLHGIPAVHNIPLDHQRPEVLPDVGLTYRVHIPSTIVNNLNQLGFQTKSTPFMIIHTALSAFLGLISSQKDIVISTAVANRPKEEFEQVVGFFVHTMLLRCQWSGNPTFSELLQSQRDDIAECFSHQHVPIDLLMEKLCQTRSASYAPLSQIMLVFQNNDHGTFSYGDITVTPCDLTRFSQSAKFDLYLSVIPKNDGSYECQWEFNTALFHTQTIQRLAHQFTQLLSGIGHNSQQNLSTLISDNDELDEWVQTADWAQQETVQQHCTPHSGAQKNNISPTHAVADKFDHETMPPPILLPAHADSIMPVTEQEAEVAELWKAVLNCSHIEPEDNFFELGGHSLKLTKLFSQVYKKYGITPDYAAFFNAPTIRAMVKGLSQNRITATPPQQDAQSPEFIRGGAEYYPLTYNQQQLWFLEHLQGSSNQYSMTWIYELEGQICEDQLQRSLDLLQQKHPALRTNFELDDSENVWQKIALKGNTKLQTFDISAFSPHEQQDKLSELSESLLKKPLSLSKDALFQVILVHCADDLHFLAIRLHHIIADGWSVNVLFGDLGELYSTDHTKLLDVNTHQTGLHCGHVAKREQTHNSEDAAKALRFWRKHLLGAPKIHALPTAHPRPDVLPIEGKTYWHDYRSIRDQVNSFSLKQETTPFVTLYTAFSVFIGELSRQQDVVIGTPVANRKSDELDNVVGYFANTIALRSQWDTSENFHSLLQRNHFSLLDSYPHQSLPFQALVNELAPTRSLSHSPIFQIMFVLQNNEFPDVHFDGLSIKPMQSTGQQGQVKFDLAVAVYEDSDQLTMSWEYNSVLFDDQTIITWASDFEQFVSDLLQNPSSAIGKHHSEPSSTDFAMNTAIQSDAPSHESPALMYVCPEKLAVSQRVFAKVLGQDDIKGDTNFFEAGGHSLLSIKLIGKLKKALGENIEIHQFFLSPTPEGVVRSLESSSESFAEKPVFDYLIQGVQPFTIKANTSVQPMVLLPGIGGLGNAFFHLIPHLDAEHIIGFHLLDPDAPTVRALAESLVDTLAKMPNVTKPVFVGHSLGGCVAYLCQEIWQSRFNVQCDITLLDSYPLTGHVGSINALADQFIQAIESQIPLKAKPTEQDISSTEQLLAFLLEHCDTDSEQLAQIELLWLVYQKQASYCFSPDTSCAHQIDYITATAPATVCRLWQQAADRFRLHESQGDHFNMLSPRHAEHTAQLINQAQRSLEPSHLTNSNSEILP